MGTREGVEKLPSTKAYEIASRNQINLIQSVAERFPNSKKFLEYEDFYAMPTRENANEFLDAVAERYADRADELKGFVNYISNRPGVEKLGSHGLFTQIDMPLDLDTVAERVAAHDGIIWTEVVSLRREDAERLHFNNAEAWKNLVRRNMNEIAKAHRIKVEDLEWYGAFHNTTHHPHIHLVIFSKGQEGFLSEKGIKELRRAFGQDIFRYEQYKLARIETGYRNQLKEQMKDLLQQLQTRQIPNADYFLLLLRKIKEEVQQQKGKKLYGYLPRKTKKLVDFALHEFAKEGDLAEIYFKWNEVNREKLSLYYDTEDKPDVPIEKNTELRSLKNMLIRTALSMSFNADVKLITARVGYLFSMLAKAIVKSAGKRLDELNKMMPRADSKEREKIRDKKIAHGQKEGSDAEPVYDNEVYDSQAAEGILTMLDYLLSLSDQSREQESEAPAVPSASDFDFDNAYAEYESEFMDDDYDEDYDDDEEQGWTISM